MKRHLIALTLFIGLFGLSLSADEKVPVNSNMVYICDSDGAYAYHLDKNCQGLKRCKHTVRYVTLEEAFKKGKKKFCGYED